MRHLIGIFFLSSFVFGQGVHILTSSNNIGANFTSAYPQLAMTLVSPGRQLSVFNSAASVISVTCTSTPNVPSSSLTANQNQIFVGPSSGKDGLVLPYSCGKYVWVRAPGGAISSGDVILNTF